MKRVILIISIVIFLLIVAVAGFFAFRAGWISFKSDPKEYTYSLGEFTVNLDDPEYNRYLKVSIQAAYDYEKLGSELTEKSYRMSDIINNVLRSKKLDDVNAPGKTDAVKIEIKEKINNILDENKLTAIYFSEIIVQ